MYRRAMIRLLIVALPIALLCACSKSPEPFANVQITELGQQRWARTCAMCHVRGEGGAPRVGDRDAWAPRLAQGEDVLLAHTIDGFNNMPPLGYCMDCEREDLRAYIAFMSAGAGS